MANPLKEKDVVLKDQMVMKMATPLFKEKDGILKDLGIDTSITFKQLKVEFDASNAVSFGNTLKLADVKMQPNVQLEHFKDSKFHTLAMVDPDAPSRKNPIYKVRKIKTSIVHLSKIITKILLI